MSGSRKSFHTHSTFVIVMVAVMGFSMGSTIRKKVCREPHPSMAAASSISIGILFTNPWYKKIAILTPRPAYTNDKPTSEFLIFSASVTLYSGIIMELNGINIEKMNSFSRKRDSLVLVRQSFHPASAENRIISDTLNPARITVLTKLRP